MKKRALVICDLDKTLIKVNTSFHFGKYLWRAGLLSSSKALMLIKYYLRHYLNLESSSTLHQKSFDLLFKGACFKKIDDLAHIFAQKICKEQTAKDVEAFIKEKKREGAYMCLLSTGPDIIVRHFGSLFGFDIALGTSYLCDENQQFSEVGKVIDGKEKSEMAAIWMMKEDFARTYALTDSIRDLDLLKIVSNPIVVNPDFRLKNEAKVRGFPMLNS